MTRPVALMVGPAEAYGVDGWVDGTYLTDDWDSGASGIDSWADGIDYVD